MMDVIMYNELSQLLFMNHLMQKSSSAYQKLTKYIAQPNLNEDEIEVRLILKHDNVVRWFTQSMKKDGDKIPISIKKYDHQLRTMLQHTA